VRLTVRRVTGARGRDNRRRRAAGSCMDAIPGAARGVGGGAIDGAFYPILDHAGEWYAAVTLWTYGKAEFQSSSSGSALAGRSPRRRRGSSSPGG
jgi:hypothetical protein